jgi:hypothetical protein
MPLSPVIVYRTDHSLVSNGRKLPSGPKNVKSGVPRSLCAHRNQALDAIMGPIAQMGIYGGTRPLCIATIRVAATTVTAAAQKLPA